MVRFVRFAAAFAAACGGFALPLDAGHAAPPQGPAAIVATGSLRIEVELIASATLPDASAVSLNVSALAADATFTNGASASTQVAVSGRKVVAVMTLPYNWPLASAGGKVQILLGANAYVGELDISSSFDREIALPANGAATTVRFTGSI